MIDYGTKQAGLRLRRLQALVSSAGLDGLLLVTGVDSKYSVGCAQAVAYLLQGASNRDAAEAVHLAEDLADAVLLVTPSELVAYVPRPETAGQIYDLFAESTPGCTVLVPTPEEAADPDAVEETKLGAFVALLRGKKLLAMPWVVPPTGGSTPPDATKPPSPMQLEQWPLLQAVGLEGVGRPGFFTQNFKASAHARHAPPCDSEQHIDTHTRPPPCGTRTCTCTHTIRTRTQPSARTHTP